MDFKMASNPKSSDLWNIDISKDELCDFKTLTCANCNLKTKTAQLLKVHLNSFKHFCKVVKGVCPKCSVVYRKKDFRQHFLKCEGKKLSFDNYCDYEKLICSCCDYKTTSVGYLREHQKSYLHHFKAVDGKCAKCDATFAANSVQTYRKHVKECKGESENRVTPGKSFEINTNVSSTKSSNAEVLNCAMENITNWKSILKENSYCDFERLTCSYCKYTAPTVKRLQVHSQSQEHFVNVFNRTCPNCGTVFAKLSTYVFVKHIEKCKSKDNQIASDVDYKLLKCFTCNIKFDASYRLPCHIKSAPHIYKKYSGKCPSCGVTYKHMISFKTHIQKCTATIANSNPVKTPDNVVNKTVKKTVPIWRSFDLIDQTCDFIKLFCVCCKYKALTVNRLRIHKNSLYHFFNLVKGECPICSDVFSNYNRLHKHIKNCDKRTKLWKSMKEIDNQFCDYEKLTCASCNFTTTTTSRLRVHQNSLNHFFTVVNRKCPKCSISFAESRVRSFRDHINQCAGLEQQLDSNIDYENLKCLLCDLNYKSSVKLFEHIKSKKHLFNKHSGKCFKCHGVYANELTFKTHLESCKTLEKDKDTKSEKNENGPFSNTNTQNLAQITNTNKRNKNNRNNKSNKKKSIKTNKTTKNNSSNKNNKINNKHNCVGAKIDKVRIQAINSNLTSEADFDAKELQCTICKKKFDGLCKLRNHERTQKHLYVKFKGKCNNCKYGSVSYKEFLRHSKTCTGEEPLKYRTSKCPHPDCPKIFFNTSSLSAHMKYSHGPNKYTCLECGLIFGDIHAFKKHAIKIHRAENIDNIVTTHKVASVTECPFCRETFLCYSTRNLHMQFVHRRKWLKDALLPFSTEAIINRDDQPDNLENKREIPAVKTKQPIIGVQSLEKDVIGADCTLTEDCKNSESIANISDSRRYKRQRKTSNDNALRTIFTRNQFKPCSNALRLYQNTEDTQTSLDAYKMQQKKKFKSTHCNTTEKIPCTMCPNVFNNLQSIRKHVKLVHLKEEEYLKVPDTSFDKRFTCDICTETFLTDAALRLHISFMHKTLPYDTGANTSVTLDEHTYIDIPDEDL